MTRCIHAALVACVLAACAPIDAKDPGVSQCDAAKLQWAIGQPATEEVGRRLVRESGMGLWRIVAPDSAEHRDYRPDRLTVHTDKDNIIQSLECR